MRRELSEKQQKLIAGLSILIFVLLSAAVVLLVGKPLVRSISKPEQFKLWLDDFGFWGRLCYMGMVVLQVFFAVIPGEPFEIFGGYAFGAVEGTILNLAASWLGGLLVFSFVRRFGVCAVEVFFSKEKIESLKFLRRSPKREAWLFFLYTVPGTPKDLLCYFAGLTDIDAQRWILFSLVGRLPSIFTSTFGGHFLSSKNYLGAVLVFGITFLLSAIGFYIYYRLCQKHAR